MVDLSHYSKVSVCAQMYFKSKHRNLNVQVLKQWIVVKVRSDWLRSFAGVLLEAGTRVLALVYAEYSTRRLKIKSQTIHRGGANYSITRSLLQCTLKLN